MATAEANLQNKLRKGKKSPEENLEEYAEVLDENANAESKKIEAEQIKQSSEEDLESLLKLAEELKDKIENPIKFLQILLFRIIQGLSIFILLFDFYLFFSQGKFPLMRMFEPTNSFPNYSYSIIIFIMIYSVLIITPMFCEINIRKIRKDSLPNKLALKEVLQLLREVHGTIAEREDWSILKRAEFRIRLSRFDLSEKKDSIFSLFS